eukprot:6204979-Pleurochrysis_carterae.AAC.4
MPGDAQCGEWPCQHGTFVLTQAEALVREFRNSELTLSSNTLARTSMPSTRHFAHEWYLEPAKECRLKS